MTVVFTSKRDGTIPAQKVTLPNAETFTKCKDQWVVFDARGGIVATLPVNRVDLIAKASDTIDITGTEYYQSSQSVLPDSV